MVYIPIVICLLQRILRLHVLIKVDIKDQLVIRTKLVVYSLICAGTIRVTCSLVLEIGDTGLPLPVFRCFLLHPVTWSEKRFKLAFNLHDP